MLLKPAVPNLACVTGLKASGSNRLSEPIPPMISTSVLT